MRRRKDEGIALILALLVLVILVVVILQMTASSLHNRTLAENHLSDLQNTYGARAGYARALLFLQEDLEKSPEVDSLRERWATPLEFPMGKAQVKVSIADSERYINLSQLVNDKGEVNPTVASQLKRLVKLLRHTPDIADRIIDYIDQDTKGEFEAKAKNDKLFNMDELLRIEGLTPEIVYGGVIQGQETKGLREFLTIWPKAPPEGGTGTAGMVNVNTASSEVLQSLSDLMTPAVAEAIVNYRTQPGTDGKMQEFQKVDDLKRVQTMTDGIFTSIQPQLVVKSSTFEIRSRGTVANVEKTWVYVVQRKGGGTATPVTPPPSSGGAPPPPAATATHTLIGAQSLNDFTSAKPPEIEK
ncbi:MAG: general secretion pathway protein GspK [Planctomycetota bacterium]|nr:MAG: general secretion pathway protein GspK [Planctomycetota bacterium]